MLDSFRLYDLFILSFVQLVVSFVLVLSPARNIDIRFRWTGSRITEVILGGLVAAAVAAVSCFLAAVLWALPIRGLEAAAYVLVVFAVVVIIVRPDTSVIGKIFYASYAAAGFTFLGYAAVVAANSTRSIAEALTASLLLLLNLGAFLVWNSNINYVSDVMGRTRRSRPLPVADPTYQPFVSLHIPAYNEPPELLIATIKAVEEIDYPNFEIVVIDNNTADASIYGPVEEYCRGRERVKFVHVAPWPGYKAGACNLALRRYTDPRVEIIGLIDADDIVQPYYLRETVSYFSDQRVGFVQTFEGNRDFEGSNYYTACVDSYQGFYLAVMSSRNERDTVPFVGTMGLFRRSALEGIGGWNEWCISEDTEASLRVLKAGWSGLYIPRRFGRGIVPPTFAGVEHAAASLVLRRDADHAPALAQPDAVGPLPRQPSVGQPAARLPHGVARMVPRPPDVGLRAAAARDHGAAADQLRLRADAAAGQPVAPADVAHPHRDDLYVVDPAPLDDDLVAPGRQSAAHQSLRELDHRARLRAGTDAP